MTSVERFYDQVAAVAAETFIREHTPGRACELMAPGGTARLWHRIGRDERLAWIAAVRAALEAKVEVTT